jgi:delta8-fatty-acid desaturase
MQRYQMGRIEGRWKNFSPPIQGGKFRPYVEGTSEKDSDDEVEVASPSGSSRAPSPIFDAEDPAVRQRRSDLTNRSSSVSSVSSEAANEPQDGLSYLDARTRELIDLDLTKYPPLDAATQDHIVYKYRLLNDRIRAEGLYECNYWAYAIECSRYVLLFSLMLLCLQRGWYGASGLFLGCFWHQLVFVAHDAGHMGITHDFTIDTVIGIIIGDFIGGLSLGWWKRTHNVHHIVTNSPEHDPDNQHMPFLAPSHRFLESLYSTYHERIMAFDDFAKLVVPYQAYLYYPLLTLWRFNLYVQSWIYLFRGLGPKKGPAWWTRWLEIAGQFFFWIWFGYGIIYASIPTAWGRFTFIMASHMITMPLHVQITLSHFAMSTVDLGPHESFPQKMLRTTMDVDCPQWLDFFHGGLQFQAIHHLYPRIPRHNLRATQKLVQEFCTEVGIPYALLGFVDGNREVIGRLDEVGRQAAILARCKKAIAEKGGVLHGH